MIVTLAKRYNDAMMDIVERYKAAGGEEPVDLDALAKFAVNNGFWQKHPSKLLQMCKRDLARALGEQSHVDPQGRRVRTYHAAQCHDSASKQKWFWADIRSATRDYMELAFQHRRNQIVGKCRQLKSDVESYNDNNMHGARIQMVFDFRDDLAELEQPTDYRPSQPR